MRQIRGEFQHLARQNVDVTLDFRHVDFVDSSGIGGIVALLTQQRANGRQLKLVNVKGQPLQLLHMLCLNFLIEQRPNAASARSPALMELGVELV